jgi:ATP-binding cassette subfamily B protein
LKDLYRRTVSATFITQTVGTTSSLGVRLAEVVVIGVGSYMAFKGYLSIGGLVAFILLLDDSTGDAYSLAKKVMPSIVAAGSGIQRIDEFLHEPSQVEDAPDAVSLAPLSREIRFDDISFAYEPDHPVLDHVSFTIPVGQYAAFVGPTGAGKTSVLNLLCRFYDVTSGAVRVDGHDVRGVTQESLRAQMAAVLQETFLFNTSIRENIKLGKLSATEDEIVAAARAAEIHDAIVKLPHGYDTLTGEMGGLLSAGQRQRLAIARAILRDPRILILDEPTSDLDAATEAAINATLERLARDRTVVAVTHRLGAVLHADQIYVIEGGRIAEQGRHQDLLDRRGLYYQLWQTQHASSPSEPA